MQVYISSVNTVVKLASLSTTVFTQLTISTADCLRKPHTAQQMAVEHTHIWELHTLIVNELLAAPSSCS